MDHEAAKENKNPWSNLEGKYSKLSKTSDNVVKNTTYKTPNSVSGYHTAKTNNSTRISSQKSAKIPVKKSQKLPEVKKPVQKQTITKPVEKQSITITPHSENVTKIYKKIKGFIDNKESTIDDIYDKLEELMAHLDKLASKKDQQTKWTDGDFELISQIILLVCGCQIRTKYIDDETKIDILGPHNSGYKEFKKLVRYRYDLEKNMKDAREDEYLPVLVKYNELQLLSVLQTYLDINQVENAKEYATLKSTPKYRKKT